MKLKKSIASVCTALLLTAVSAHAATLEFTIGSDAMYCVDPDSSETASAQLETAPYTYNDRTMVPVRIISERFGASVVWNDETQSVSIEKDGQTILLTLGSDTALVNGSETLLDAAPQEYNGRTMVPLRFISETLGMNVEYVALSQQVLITDETSVMTINGHNIMPYDFRSLKNIVGYEYETSDVIDFVEFAIPIFKECIVFSDAAEYAGYDFGDAVTPDDISEYAGSGQAYSNNTLMASNIKLTSYMSSSQDYLNRIAEYISNNVFYTTTTEELRKIYESEYICAKHILISTLDSETREPYSADRKAEAYSKATNILTRLKNGADFDTLLKDYGEDPGTAQQPDGYVFTKGQMVENFENAAFALKTGEISGIVESEYGYHIIKREPLPELDDYTANDIIRKLFLNEFNDYYTAAINSATIEMNMTNEEIAELLK